MFQQQPLSIRDQTCPQPTCIFFGIKLAANIIVHGSKKPRFRCKSCGKTWVGHHHQTHYGLRTDLQKILWAQEMLNAGKSIRIVAQEVEVSPSTIQRWKKRWKWVPLTSPQRIGIPP